MLVIHDRDGNIIQRSRNLAGIRHYVNPCSRDHNPLIKVIDINEDSATGEGRLSILFENGASFETDFASFSVLKHWVRRWQNVYGAPLRVQGKDCRTVGWNAADLA